MSPLTAAAGVVLFAFVTAMLFLWGMRKAMGQEQELSRRLYSKAAQKVISYLKKHSKIDRRGLKALLEGLSATQPFSRKKAVILQKEEFLETLLHRMVQEGLVRQAGKFYCLPEKPANSERQ